MNRRQALVGVVLVVVCIVVINHSGSRTPPVSQGNPVQVTVGTRVIVIPDEFRVRERDFDLAIGALQGQTEQQRMVSRAVLIDHAIQAVGAMLDIAETEFEPRDQAVIVAERIMVRLDKLDLEMSVDTSARCLERPYKRCSEILGRSVDRIGVLYK